MYRIHSTTTLAAKIREFWVEAPLVATKYRAGQFVIIRVTDDGERIPLTVVETKPAEGLVRLIVQEAGKSTHEMCEMKPGDALQDVVGPLGQATHIEMWGNLVIIGGGVGAAPVLPMAKAARAAGNKVFAIIGARSQELLILEDEFRASCDAIRVSTDDGSYAVKGFVTDVLRQWVAEGQVFQQAIIAGPVPMMAAVAAVTKELGIPAMASLNPVMVDGTGMCGGCRVTVHGKTYFACVDGPEFDAHGVDFRELSLRNAAYRDIESRTLTQHFETADHHCKLTPQAEGAPRHG
jgi:ferredoxin--NADP+ reductase